MRYRTSTSVTFSVLLLTFIFAVRSNAQEAIDTSYLSIATPSVQKMTVNGKAPRFTFQISGFYDIGLLDLASDDNALFHKLDFIEGRNFGSRYGFGFGITGKLALHKEGNMRLTLSSLYNRLQSDFVIGTTPEGRVAYNVFSWGLGIEDNFLPDRQLKPYIGAEVIASLIYGDAILATDSVDFKLKIKNSFRIGFGVNLGFEYAVSNQFGFNLGLKLTHVNVILRDSKQSTNINETYLNDASSNQPITYAGWKQFFFASFYGGVNFYIGMKNKKGF